MLLDNDAVLVVLLCRLESLGLGFGDVPSGIGGCRGAFNYVGVITGFKRLAAWRLLVFLPIRGLLRRGASWCVIVRICRLG